MRAAILVVLVSLFTVAVVAAIAFNIGARVILAAPDVPQVEARVATGALDLFAVVALVSAAVLCGVERVRRGW